MTIDTSREAVERMANDLRRTGHSGNFGILPVALALLAERDAALAEVARLSTPPDDAEVNIMVRWLRIGGGEHSNAIADALTRLSHALAAETAKREAMEEALEEISTYDTGGTAGVAYTAKVTLAKHGSKT